MTFSEEDLALRAAKHAEDGVTMVQLSNGYEVFTQQFGASEDTKVLVLHGGPACTHEYMLNIAYQLPDHAGLGGGAAEVHMYDQLGSFYSDQPEEDLWNIPRWVQEVDEVRQALGMDSTNFYLLGNSWGGMLAMEYALAHPEHLKGLVVCNMQSSIPITPRTTRRCCGRPCARRLWTRWRPTRRPGRTTTRPTSNWWTRNSTASTCAAWTLAGRRDWIVRTAQLQALRPDARPERVQGGRRIIDWDITARLPEIATPTLMVGATHDTMDPEAMRRQADLVQHGRALICEEGSTSRCGTTWTPSLAG